MVKVYVILGIFVLAICVGAAYFAAKGLRYAGKMMKTESTVDTVPQDYLSLFNRQSVANFTAYRSDISAGRQPVASFMYDRDYCVMVYKLDTVPGFSMDSIFTTRTRNGFNYQRRWYRAHDQRLFVLNTRGGAYNRIQKMFLSSNDSARLVVKNDSVACYYLQNGGFMLAYEKNKAVEVYTQFKEKFVLLHHAPMELLFRKRGNALYFILLSVDRERIPLRPGMLNSLTVGA